GEVVASVVDESFRQDLNEGPAMLIGDGAAKCTDILAAHPAEWIIEQCFPTAADLIPETLALIQRGQMESVSDFEPFYLKDFIPGQPKDPLGLRNPSA
ncbi:MAG: hypothetical protein P8P45_07960, partial [Flavobacteriales bacterium]|nr:hypothetical protein [Flavobacteriales bacterium]